MRCVRKKIFAGFCTVFILCGVTACGMSEKEKEGMDFPKATATVALTEEPEPIATIAPTDEPKPTATSSPTPEPTHAPAKNEGVKIPAEYLTIRREASGTVEAITYKTKDYYGGGEEVIKPAYVYLPFGYDEEKQYNVLYMMHGGGSDENEWGIHREFSTSKIALDNLIYFGDIEPLIVVFPNGRTGVDFAKRADDSKAFKDFGTELRNDLIPYIDANYATYADYNPEGYDLTEARDHRAMGGLSFGSMQTINIGLCECLDVMSYFGAFSPANTTYEAAKIAECLEKFEPYDIHCIYEICGDWDKGCLYVGYDAFMDLPKLTDKVVNGENLIMQIVPGGHDMNVWQLGYYNFLQVVFQ